MSCQSGYYVMSVWSICHVWLEFLISLVYMSCESGDYVICLVSMSCQSGQYVMSVWSVCHVSLDSMSCHSGQ